MSRVRAKNTGPELTVRRLIHALGYRFRLHFRDLPGTPDLVFPGRRNQTSSSTAVSGIGIPIRTAGWRGCPNRGRNSGGRSWREIARAMSDKRRR